jgi:hypothetical protein
MAPKDEIEQRFANAGWDIDDGFSGYLVIGYSNDAVSIVAHQQSNETDEALFEVLDHVHDVSYWVAEVPSPEQARTLLGKYGKPPEEWDGYPY